MPRYNKPMPKYVQTRVLKGNHRYNYRYSPPQKYIDMGLVKRCELGRDRAIAREQAEQYNKIIDDYNKQFDSHLRSNSTLNSVIEKYLCSKEFNELAEQTKKNYRWHIQRLKDRFGHQQCRRITVGQLRHAYNEWADKSLYTANDTFAIGSALFSYAVRRNVIDFNPFNSVTKRGTKPRRVMWTREEVHQFLTHCYSHFETRNVGLIVHMAYNWGQRVGDMRLLKWEGFDWENKSVKYTQSKRNATVHLPIDDGLFRMLKQQHEDFGFQPYVAPKHKPERGEFAPYSMGALSMKARKLMNEIGLRKELRIADLRRTAVTEMFEAGADTFSVMSVSGHKNPASLTPYQVNTLDSAKNALNLRKGTDTYDYS